MQNITSIPVVCFAVVARIGQQCFNSDIRIETIQRFSKLMHIRTRSSPGYGRQNQVGSTITNYG
jgi:hypothetical protein